MTHPTPSVNWKDFGERVWRAAYIGAVSAAAAIPIADILALITGDGNTHTLTWRHLLATIGTAALTSAVTAIKAAIGQGRGTNPADGSVK